MRHLVVSLYIKLNSLFFSLIVPCGIKGKGVTSLSQELNRDVNVQETQSYLVEQFEKIFQCDIIERNFDIIKDSEENCAN